MQSYYLKDTYGEKASSKEFKYTRKVRMPKFSKFILKKLYFLEVVTKFLKFPKQCF